MADLKNKTLFITGASRGIGKAIGLRAARDGANVVIAAKTTDPHPELPGLVSVTANEFYARHFFSRWRDELQAVEDHS